MYRQSEDADYHCFDLILALEYCPNTSIAVLHQLFKSDSQFHIFESQIAMRYEKIPGLCAYHICILYILLVSDNKSHMGVKISLKGTSHDPPNLRELFIRKENTCGLQIM